MNTLLVFAFSNAIVAAGIFAAVYAMQGVDSQSRGASCPLGTRALETPDAADLEPSGSLAPGDRTDGVAARRLEPSLVNRLRASQRIFSPAAPAESRGARPCLNTISEGGNRRAGVARAGLSGLVVAGWAIGSLVWFALARWRIGRFRRGLRFASEAPRELQQTAKELARELGLRRCPRVWLVPGRVSPMLWAFPGRARVILPDRFFAELDPRSREVLLLHELAHYRRGDHRVRLLEFLALGFYWWNPVLWLLRHEIRFAEERACDAWVVSRRPQERRTYAEVLVKILGFLSTPDLPSFASGVVARGSVEERIGRIMREAAEPRLWRRNQFVVCLLALLLLPLAPACGSSRAEGRRGSPG